MSALPVHEAVEQCSDCGTTLGNLHASGDETLCAKCFFRRPAQEDERLAEEDFPRVEEPRRRPRRKADLPFASSEVNEPSAVTFDAKGALVLPPAPDPDDPPALCAWLTVALNRDPRHPITGAEWQGPNGPDGHVKLTRAAAPAIRFEPARSINRPQSLIEALAWQRAGSDGAPHAYKAGHCRDISFAIACLCDMSAAESEYDQAAGILGTFLQGAEPIEGLTTYEGSVERYEAASALRREDSYARARYLIDRNTGELVIAASDLQDAARKHVGSSLPRGWLAARLGEVGWQRIRIDGHALPGRAGRTGPHATVTAYRGLVPTPEQERTDDRA